MSILNADLHCHSVVSDGTLTPEALALLERHPWPGNVRELGNVIERLVLLADHPLVHAPELARHLATAPSLATAVPPAPPAPAFTQGFTSAFPPAQATPAPGWGTSAAAPPLVRPHWGAQSHSAAELGDALARHHGNRSRAAQSLGLTLRQFTYRLEKAGLKP